MHDPVVIKVRDTYYVFSTGGRPGQGVVPIRTSEDMRATRRNADLSPRSDAPASAGNRCIRQRRQCRPFLRESTKPVWVSGRRA